MQPKTLADLQKKIHAKADPHRASHSQRFFKTGPGEYGEGDLFLGLKVPEMRAIAKPFYQLPLPDIRELLQSEFHEERFIALVLLVRQYEKGDEKTKEDIFQLYLENLEPNRLNINNWDLVDTSAPQIVGAHLKNRNRNLLYTMAESENLWKKRVAILATFSFIRSGEFEPTLKIAFLLLNDEHDLIHKAVGWMLREVANRDRALVEAFLTRHCAQMPRTMLRYAIEKFPEPLRKEYLHNISKNNP